MNLFMYSRYFCILLFMILGISQSSAEDWQNILNKAKGQTVYFNAWGGAENINDYIRWVGEQVKQGYDINLKQVKVSNTADVVSRVLAEKTAGVDKDGSVDLVWINGENFRAMKDRGLLLAPWTNRLPNHQLLDFENKPTLSSDFQIPVNNQSSPWGMAQLVFMYDQNRLPQAPKSMPELLNFVRQNQGRFSYPAPPDFYGLTFVKQALVELIEKPEVLAQVVDEQTFKQHTQALWKFLDSLHPHLWQQGKSFPKSIAEMKSMLNNGEIFISFSFNPNDAANAVNNGELPASLRSYIHTDGTIGNTHFVAIPYNAKAREAAMVVANFLISEQAQYRKMEPSIWGDPTVLAMQKITQEYQKKFANLDFGKASLTPQELQPTLLEPHASWSLALEKAWLERYAN